MVLTALPIAPAQALSARDIAGRIKSLRASLNAVGHRLDTAEQALEHANVAIARHTAELQRAQGDRLALRGVVGRRAAALYMFGTQRELTLLGTAEDLDRMAYLEQMAVGERALLERIASLTRNARAATRALRADRAEASARAHDLNARRSELFRKLHDLEKLESFLQSVAPRPGLRGSRGARGMICPLTGYHYISNNFGDPRPGGPHTGDDIAAPYGTPARAVLPATVVDTPVGGWMGYGIIIRDLSGTEWWYAHLSLVAVHRGERVDQGEFIGRVGCSGNCSGPHLHFEWHPGGGAPQNPYRLLTAVC